MAGLYVHIPFCRTRCVYCAFHSGTDLALRHRYVNALNAELRMRSAYLPDKRISTVYFGGGTPSTLCAETQKSLLDAVQQNFEVAPDAEITIECNPDDMTEPMVAQLAQLAFNRVSLGVQSFDDAELTFLHRRHTAAQAVNAVRLLQQYGFGNISIDLMYGLPRQTLQQWTATLQTALSLGIQHLSAYNLMYEEHTLLTQWRQTGRIVETDETVMLAMFDVLIEQLETAGYEHYEISNFCQQGFRSRHNSAYWHGVPYLGVGAAAHSYNGTSRQWNVADTRAYIEAIEQERIPAETEYLTDENRYNEFVFTGLRTSDGVDLTQLAAMFGSAAADYCLRCATAHLRRQHLQLRGNHLCLTRAGIFVSDGIMADLMSVNHEVRIEK
ncbi:MAG: radical SAM family heme chaperone HemW [Paludibacteraceae bacterium]